jgi:hypothetical protein
MPDTAYSPRISLDLLRRIERLTARPSETRPVPGTGHVELSRRLRSIPPANLRRRIYPS